MFDLNVVLPGESQKMWLDWIDQDMNRTERFYLPYKTYFAAFHKLRHDFANYVQVLQLFEDGHESFEAKEQRMELYTQMSELVLMLLPEVDRILASDGGQEELPSFNESKKMGKIVAMRVDGWLRRKAFFKQIEKELCDIYSCVYQSNQIFEGSLPPDMREAEQLLASFDEIYLHDLGERLVFASLLSETDAFCHEHQLGLKTFVKEPKSMRIEIPDLFYMLDCLLGYVTGHAAVRENGEILCKTSEQFGMWHLKLCYPAAAHEEEEKLLKYKDASVRLFYQMLQYYKIKLKYKTEGENTEIDLIHCT
jgi:hypothetical protein